MYGSMTNMYGKFSPNTVCRGNTWSDVDDRSNKHTSPHKTHKKFVCECGSIDFQICN